MRGKANPSVTPSDRDERFTLWQAQEARRVQERAIDRNIALWTASGVEERHRGRVLSDLCLHERWARAYAAMKPALAGGGIVVLLGDRGNGKTQLGVEHIRFFCRDARPCLYVRSREIGMKLRESYDAGSKVSEQEAVGHFARPDLLVVDECQEQPDKDFERRSFTLIMDLRYAALRPSILIANATEPAFWQAVGASIKDRVLEGGLVLRLDWPSLRRAYAANQSL